MKIVIIGSDEVYAMEHFFVKHLSDFPDTEVRLLAINKWIKAHLSLFNKIERRLFPNRNNLYRGLNQFIIEQIGREKPDIVLVFKGMEIFPETLQYLRKQNILLTNFNPDHPFLKTSRSTALRNMMQGICHYNLHFTYNQDVLKKIQSEYDVPTVYLPFGYELPADLELSNSEDEILAVCFIGTADSIRLNHINTLLEAGVPVHVYGSEWLRFANSNSQLQLKINAPVYNQDFWKVVRRYRVQLNVFRPHNIRSHNMRTFEMPAAGTIMLAPDSPEHRLFFEEGKEAFFYKNTSDMVLKAQQILTMTKLEADKVRYDARKRSVKSDYSYANRAKTVKSTLDKLYA